MDESVFVRVGLGVLLQGVQRVLVERAENELVANLREGFARSERGGEICPRWVRIERTSDETVDRLATELSCSGAHRLEELTSDATAPLRRLDRDVEMSDLRVVSHRELELGGADRLSSFTSDVHLPPL